MYSCTRSLNDKQQQTWLTSHISLMSRDSQFQTNVVSCKLIWWASELRWKPNRDMRTFQQICLILKESKIFSKLKSLLSSTRSLLHLRKRRRRRKRKAEQPKRMQKETEEKESLSLSNKSNSPSKQLRMLRCRMNSKKLSRTSLLKASERLVRNSWILSHQSMSTVDRNQFTHQLFDKN